ncbi:hypothetical protein [Xanthovirga aplysinae]|uniref:hypothetical protein n=1 Tax=Xanthovirga aplysinae TaxID=2529853 RepID=UPI0012BC66DE|nr:hypothetical protein [Xanthovirga aplysinae]MTI33224.1 hypothetical protein [Xanthovirga aplysinae]
MKDFDVIEILAAIILFIGVIKIIVIFISPNSWYKFVERIYANTQITKSVYLISAAIVLYLLVQAGITIIEIFAVLLFLSLLMGVGFTNYVKDLLQIMNPDKVVKENLVYIAAWIVLMIWGISELFIS